jgi:competence protein ComEC
VGAGDRIPIGPGVRCYVLAPAPGASREVKDINNASVILQIVYGEQRLLFMGDAGQLQERRLLDRFKVSGGSLLRSDYLKVGHHGSNTSSGEDLLRVVRPAVSVTSLAWKNRYRHPDPDAVQRLLKWTEDTLHFTSRDRAVIYATNGRRLRRIDWDNQQF